MSFISKQFWNKRIKIIKQFLVLAQPTNCYEQDMSIDGGNTTSSNQPFLSNGPEECQKLCQDSSECNYFVFDPTTKHCMLKRSDAFKFFKRGTKVGPKFCSNENLLFL